MFAHLTTFAAGAMVKLVSARYWRLIATGLNYFDVGNRYMWQVYTLSMYASADCTGTDLARASTASASSFYSGYPASCVRDGDDTSRWISSTTSSAYQWLAFDFGSAVTIRSISLLTVCNVSDARIPQSINIQYASDGTNWTTLKSISVPNQASSSFTNLQ